MSDTHTQRSSYHLTNLLLAPNSGDDTKQDDNLCHLRHYSIQIRVLKKRRNVLMTRLIGRLSNAFALTKPQISGASRVRRGARL